MPFSKVESFVDFPAVEREVLAFWDREDIFARLRRRNANGPRWSFLDGPITANNPMGVHHAWGRTYKDVFQRYHAMLGCHQRYQNGFDCQGLWVEVEVEKELGLKSKRDIENLVPGDKFASIQKFVDLCKQRVDRFARVQTDQSIRLGYWMDWDRGDDWQKAPDDRRSYFTMSNENNDTIWGFLRKCHDRGLVYRAHDAMPWCPRCSVGLSQMEMAEGYQMVAHRAIFVKLPLIDSPGENLLVWTTTPWTMTSNVAAAVNPELSYLKVRHKDELFYLAKGAFTAQRLEEQFRRKEWLEGVPRLKSLEQMFKEKGGYEIEGEVPGSTLVGRRYHGPFDELPAQNSTGGFPSEVARVAAARAPGQNIPSAREAHRVIPWKEVGETEGTGIVHIAPGCGKEDFGLGKENGLPVVAPLDEFGNYVEGFGELTGVSAADPATADRVIGILQQSGRLFASEKYPHKYPHCWRCKTEVLFRLVDEWFISMSWRDEISKVCHDIRWIPEFGLQRELDWLKNMGDWMISKKRFWGLALPIWVDEVTGDFEVIGSREELRARAVEGFEALEGRSPHKPWIDKVKIRNPKTGNLMSRIPDVGNPWLDAGIVPFSTMGYRTNREEWAKWYPADLITECFPGQFRNWFYSLLAMSSMLEGKAPFRALLGHALVRDQTGDEMHKSKGNSIPFEGAADNGYEIKGKDGKLEKHPPMGADLVRWMFCRQNPSQNINFGPVPAEEIRARFLLKLWNTYAFLCNYARLDGFDPDAPAIPLGRRTDLDRWILSDLQKLLTSAREGLENFDISSFCLEVERFVDDKLSNWYVRRNRRRFWKGEAGEDKTAAYQTLHECVLTLTRVLAPFIPFITEHMYGNLVGTRREASVHHTPWPQARPELVDDALSAEMEALLRLVSLGLAARNTAKIKVRQPLAVLRIRAGTDAERRAVERFADQMRDELNVKRVELVPEAEGAILRTEVKLNLKAAGGKLGARLKEAQAALAAADAAKVAAAASTPDGFRLELTDGPETLTSTDILVSHAGPDGWSGVADRETQVALDARVTPELAREGMARDIVRQVQDLRKRAGLEMEDRIALHLESPHAELSKAIDEHRATIAGETLVIRWTDGGQHAAEVKIDAAPLTIRLEKATA
mgnify:FL=1